MSRIRIITKSKRLPADIFTPVGIYLRVRDRFRDTVLLESTDHHAAENSFSYICINAIGGIECTQPRVVETKYPGLPPQRQPLKGDLASVAWDYCSQYTIDGEAASAAQGLYGYAAFEALAYGPDGKALKEAGKGGTGKIPVFRYRLYQYVLAIDHFRDQMFFFENCIEGIESESAVVESLIRRKDVPVFPFSLQGGEQTDMTNDEFRSAVSRGIAHCHRGDIFQVVLSRAFSRAFHGDEFNVYRALRSVNPSPYLFYFDYGDYRLMGSSPEAQLMIMEGKATVHPIAGTYRRTGDKQIDQQAITELQSDAKENAEHVMLVDLARNDLSRISEEVKVSSYRQVRQYSHVIHLVSEVQGKLNDGTNPFHVLFSTFPAGTLSGAPKFMAIRIIGELEKTARGYYGGAIGHVGFDGSCNQAIMIRSMMSQGNILHYRAGAGIVAASDPEKELEEVNNKLGALRHAMEIAKDLSQ